MSNEFNYTYSADKQAEINRIREKYIPKQIDIKQSKLDQLRKLDASCESAAMIAGLSTGIIGTLVFGLGMSCFLSMGLYVTGVIIGVIGVPMIIAAKPVYDKVLKSKREKAAPEILRLSSELESGEAQ